ncbi:hypothetical protein [Candidatus Tisiphia endosymbiont of Hybos culiciformis]|uniref:hypothetical protein n=1 Tax=Candidatus Tisiphia endosymbiont of Hybos culiciformis TaxID=3139331 RepID=UPI003CCA9115
MTQDVIARKSLGQRSNCKLSFPHRRESRSRTEAGMTQNRIASSCFTTPHDDLTQTTITKLALLFKSFEYIKFS